MIPTGWKLTDNGDGTISVANPQGIGVTCSNSMCSLHEDLLYSLCRTLLAKTETPKDLSVAPAYLAWLASMSPAYGHAGNVVWNAAVSWAQQSNTAPSICVMESMIAEASRTEDWGRERITNIEHIRSIVRKVFAAWMNGKAQTPHSN